MTYSHGASRAIGRIRLDRREQTFTNLHKLRRNRLYLVTLLSGAQPRKCALEQASKPVFKEVDMFAVKTSS